MRSSTTWCEVAEVVLLMLCQIRTYLGPMQSTFLAWIFEGVLGRSIGGVRDTSAPMLPLCSLACNEFICKKHQHCNSTGILRKDGPFTTRKPCSRSCILQSKQAIPTSREELPDQLGMRLMTREQLLRYALNE